MNVLDGIGSALRMIRAHKLRAFFMVLGTVIGVTFLIAVITLIQGMDRYMTEDFGGQIYGMNTVTVRRIPSVQVNPTAEERRSWQRRPRLRYDDADWIAERLESPGVIATATNRMGRVRSEHGREAENVRITGASPSYFEIRDAGFEAGRPFSSQEARDGRPVVVLGRDVADALFPDTSPLGETVRVGGMPFEVIGVLERQGSLFGMSMDNVAIGPARSRLDGFLAPAGSVSEISLRVPNPDLIPAATAELEGLMRIRHRLRPTDANTFEIETVDSALGFWDTIRQIMLVALPGLVGISLIVGGVVIMNIMLVSVTERTREIGLRKSLGARPRDILGQFLVESGFLSGLGGLMGIGLGIGLAWVVSAVSPIPAQVAPWAIGLGLGLGVGVGVIAGVYPAWRAAQLNPIDALRYE
jgi:putative ABC transport system permease protein